MNLLTTLKQVESFVSRVTHWHEGRPDKFDPDVRVECSHGIHFFLTREEAETY